MIEVEPEPQPEPHWFTGAEGNRLAATIDGMPDAPLVVLLHGGGQSRYSWKRVVPHLAQHGLHVVAYDARGHGASEWVASGRYGLLDYAADLRMIVAALGRPPALVGASLGGMTALTALGDEASALRARALVLVDIVPFGNAEGVERIRAFMLDYLEGFADTEDAVQAIARWRGDAMAEEQARRMTRSLRRADDGRLRWHWDPRIIWSGEDRDERTHVGGLSRAAAALDMPTMLLRGERSDVVGPAEAERFRELVPHCRIAVVPGMEHSVSGQALIDHSPLVEFHRESR